MLNYSLKLPNYSSISAATYLFIGYINLVIFNRVIDTTKTLRYFWVIPTLGTIILLNSFFIPIGFFGLETVGNFVFPWISTTDFLYMKYGFLERVIFLLLIVYLALTLLFAIVTSHIGLQLFKGTFPRSREGSNNRGTMVKTWIVLFCFSLMAMAFQHFNNQSEIFAYVRIWLNIRLVVEIGLVLLIFFLPSGRKRI